MNAVAVGYHGGCKPEGTMKLQWTRLPFSFDPTLLQQDLSGIAETEWHPHFNQNDYEGRWSSVALRSRNGKIDDIVPLGRAADFMDTPLMERCPHLKAAVAAFAFPKKSVRLLRLHAGSRVPRVRWRIYAARDLTASARITAACS